MTKTKPKYRIVEISPGRFEPQYRGFLGIGWCCFLYGSKSSIAEAEDDIKIQMALDSFKPKTVREFWSQQDLLEDTPMKTKPPLMGVEHDRARNMQKYWLVVPDYVEVETKYPRLLLAKQLLILFWRAWRQKDYVREDQH